MITKEGLARLNAERPNHNHELHYRIGGPVEETVHMTVEAERTGTLNRGHRILQEADDNLQQNMAFKTREGLPRAQFIQANVERPQPLHKPDIESIRSKAKQAMAYDHNQA